VKNDYETEEEDWALNGFEEPLKKKNHESSSLIQQIVCATQEVILLTLHVLCKAIF
jgi:hypothetical protein